MAVNRAPSSSRVKIILLILGLVGLLVGQAWVSVIYWLAPLDNPFESITPLACQIAPICTTLYPPYFLFAGLLLLLAIVFLALAMRHTALRVTRDIDWAGLAVSLSAGWRTRGIVFTGLAAAASLVAVVTGLSSEDRYPNGIAWAAALPLAGIAFYCFDRAHGRASVLSRADLLGVAGYILLLGALGFIYDLPLLQQWEARALLVAVVGLALFGLWWGRRLRGAAAVWVMIAVAGLAIYTYGLDAWQYAFIGDEYAFFLTGEIHLDQPGVINPLNSRGVYDTHPVLSSWIHSVNMALYGRDVYGWRLSEVFMVFLSAPSIYALVRHLKGKGAGLVAVVLFVSAHHLMAFAHIGYNNLQSLPGFAAMLAFAVIALERRSWLAMFLCGAASASAFYMFSMTIPLIPLPLLLLGLWTLLPRRDIAFWQRLKGTLPLALIFVIGVLVVSIPRLLNTIWWDDLIVHTAAFSQVEGLSNPLLEQILPNTVYTMTASLTFSSDSHYVSGAHFDPISSMLMLAGAAGMLAVALRRSVVLWLLLCFPLTAFVIGGLAHYSYPPNTRVLLMIVFYAVFAGLGAAYLWETARDVGARVSPAVLRVAFAVTAAAVVALNLYQFMVISEQKVLKTFVPFIVREWQRSPADADFYYLSFVPDDENLIIVLRAHGFDLDRWHPVMNPSEEGLREIRETATAPYRIVVRMDDEGAQERAENAERVWADREVEAVTDLSGSGFVHLKVIDVRSAE